MKNITIEMACSINGLIADENGNEDFLSERGWEIMLEFLKDYDVLIWGRKTWDNILSWGEEYLKDLENINIIVLTNEKNKENQIKKDQEISKKIKLPNVIYCSSIDECLNECNSLKYEKLFVSGGASINNAFMEKNLADNIILNYNPVVINKGIPLFNGKYFEKKLKLEKIVKEKDDIVQLQYKVIK